MKSRIQKINSLIKKELAQIILKELEIEKDNLITLTRVETSADVTLAKIFISVWPQKNFKKILEILEKNIFVLQKKLDKKLVMKNVPKIVFIEEKKVAEAGRIEELLEGLKKEKK